MKSLIKKLGLMPPNILTPSVLATYFDDSIQCINGLNNRYVGLKAVGDKKAYLGRTRRGNRDSKFRVALVGKGITFDSGGISIKPAHDMHEMKMDMLGAATVLALGFALKDINYSLDIYGCCAENTFHGPNTMRPGDVITYEDSTTVEIINTDAEGRLVLADGIIEAKRGRREVRSPEHSGGEPNLIITIATLTGAARSALGCATAVFSNDEWVAKEFMEIAAQEQSSKALENKKREDCWRLPIWDQHRENIKGQKGVSDLKNCGTIAGASTAAAFLEHFAGDTPWLHLDIAGSAYKDGVPTGAMYDTLLRYLKFLGEKNGE